MKLSLGKWLNLAVISLLTVACAPPPKAVAPVDRSAPLRKMALSSLGSGGDDSDWRCPNDYNLKLKGASSTSGFSYGGDGYFTVCVDRSETNVFKIKPGSTASHSVCVYPMYSSSSIFQIVEAPQCFSINGNPFEVTFKSTSINYMIIVESNNTEALNRCLSSSTPCPPESEGPVQ